MIIKSAKDLQVQENPHGVDVRQMYNQDNAQGQSTRTQTRRRRGRSDRDKMAQAGRRLDQ